MRPFWAADVAAPMRKEWLEKFLARCLLIAGQLLDVFGTRCDWLVSRHGLKIRVRGKCSLENSEAEILAKVGEAKEY